MPLVLEHSPPLEVTGSTVSLLQQLGSFEYQEKLPNCQSGTTVETITSRGGKYSNTGGFQEKLRQPPGKYPLIWMPALSRRVDLIAL